MKQLIILLYLILCSTFAQAAFPYEILNYELKFGFIKGGEASFIARDTIIDNQSKIHAQLHGYTTGFANALFGVNNFYGSIFDSETFLPESTTKNLSEQRYRFENRVEFNHLEQSAYSQHSGWHQVEAGICDVVTLMYNLRFSGRLDGLVRHDIFTLPFWDTDSWYMLEMRYMGLEQVKTKNGTFECIRIEPIITRGKLFDSGNPINIWFTADEKKLPILMELNFKVGSVKCELKDAV
jgi:hypothetical protein